MMHSSETNRSRLVIQCCCCLQRLIQYEIFQHYMIMDSKLTNSKTFTSTIHCRKGRKELVGDAFDIFDIYCMYMYASLLAKLGVALVGKTRSRCRVHTLLCYFSSCPCYLFAIPHICHGRRPCKFFLAGVNFYRFNAKNWQLSV